YAVEGYAIPYSEVYIRLPRCRAGTCQGHGSCDDTSGPAVCDCATGRAGAHCEQCANGYQDNDADRNCSVACSAGACTNPSEACSDRSGAIQCLPVSGTSCLDILQRDPGAASGVYIIDPDGPSGAEPFGVECDMTTAG